MQATIHPAYEPASFTCSTCGAVHEIRSTHRGLTLDVCSCLLYTSDAADD